MGRKAEGSSAKHGQNTTEKEAQLNDDFQRQYTALLMTLPIEERKTTFEQMKRQMQPVSQELWDTYAAKLYNFGLDFQTEYSPEEAEARSQQITARMAELSQQLVEYTEEAQKFLLDSKRIEWRNRRLFRRSTIPNDFIYKEQTYVFETPFIFLFIDCFFVFMCPIVLPKCRCNL